MYMYMYNYITVTFFIKVGRNFLIAEVFLCFQRLSAEVRGHQEKMESVLSSLVALGSHDNIVEPSPITEHSEKLR